MTHYIILPWTHYIILPCGSLRKIIILLELNKVVVPDWVYRLRVNKNNRYFRIINNMVVDHGSYNDRRDIRKYESPMEFIETNMLRKLTLVDGSFYYHDKEVFPRINW